jgi:putative addiction module component (TIGR02574 family)
MILETLPALGTLTVDQKLRLVWELWQDVSHDSNITSGVASLLDQRLEEHSAHPANVHSTEEVTAGILALKQRIAASRA